MSGTVFQSSKSAGNQSLDVAGANSITNNSNNSESVEVNFVMGTSTKNQDVTGKSKKKIREPAPIKEAVTSVAHCCVVVYVLLILYLCFKEPFEFFTWHPLLLSVGWALLMAEAILVISKENLLTQKFRVTHTLRIQLHWILLTIAALLIAIGFIIITISKNRKNKYHYTSWHGLLGLLGIIAYIPPCINGVLTLYSKELRDYINPKHIKLAHVITGTISFTCGGISLILSVYTKWFARRTDNDQYLFYLGLISVTVPVVWVIQRPLIKAVKNVYKLFSSED